MILSKLANNLATDDTRTISGSRRSERGVVDRANKEELDQDGAKVLSHGHFVPFGMAVVVAPNVECVRLVC